MFSKTNSIYLRGLLGTPVTVEADVSDGLPGFVLVGYLASEVREAQDRVRTALKSLDLGLPPKKVTVNISPAGYRKEGTGFDLAIAAAILAGHGAVPAEAIGDAAFLGELGLNGTVKGVPGMLSLMECAKKRGFSRVFLPEENLAEAELIEGIDAYAVTDLSELVKILKEPEASVRKRQRTIPKIRLNRYTVDFSDVNGQPLLRRAAEIAAAGMHNMLIVGPAGSGKTMVAKRMPTILPSLDLAESIEISKVYSVCRLLGEGRTLVGERPFRAPHHTVTPQALTGGGTRPKPGEISLATGGILFLDELAEMSRAALESLRQPLEERAVTVSRVGYTVSYPADFQLVAAMNLCRCGAFPLPRCTCTPNERKHYLSRVSGPLLDRIDLCVETAAASYADIAGYGKNESSAAIRERVENARKIQEERFTGLDIRCNAQMSGGHVRRFCTPGPREAKLLEDIFEKFGLSARAHDRLLKVSRTVADLAGSERIEGVHLSEALSFIRVKEAYWGA